MKIRNRLSIQFTVLVASILLILCSSIFYVLWSQTRSNFYDELRDRAVTTAYIYLEEDGFPTELYTSIRERYVRTLPEEIGQLFDVDNRPAFVEPSEETPYDESVIEYIRAHHTYPDFYAFSDGKWQSVGLFYPDNQGDFVVIVSAIDRTGRAQLTNLAWTLAFGYLIAVVVLFFAGRFFALQALKPIPAILGQVRAITPSNLDKRLDRGKEDDEISELVDTFNRFLDRLEESFNSQKRFVANASHELRTPLTSIIGEIEVALNRERSAEDYTEVLKSVHHDTLVLRDLVTGLLEIAQAESSGINYPFERVRADELVIEAGMIVEREYPGTRVNVNYFTDNGHDTEFLIHTCKPLLLNVFINVIENAVKFSPDHARTEVALRADGDRIEVEVSDRGIGIDKKDMDRIFDPFYRSDSALPYQGFGIGLSLVKRILAIVKGEIRVDSEPGEGTVVTLSFVRQDDWVSAPLIPSTA